MNRNRRIFFLLLINLSLTFISLYVLDMLQIIDYKQLLSKIPLMKQAYAVKIEDPFLLERLELEKKWQILDEKVRNYEEEKKNLEEALRNLAIARDDMEKREENIRNMIDDFVKQTNEQESYEKRVDQVAEQIENMPPKSAVAILEKQDDMMIIDVIKRINARATDAGKQSTAPYLLSLMDPEQSARIQRKMLE